MRQLVAFQSRPVSHLPLTRTSAFGRSRAQVAGGGKRCDAAELPALLRWDAMLEAALGELARQTTVHCAERGLLLHMLLAASASVKRRATTSLAETQRRCERESFRTQKWLSNPETSIFTADLRWRATSTTIKPS